MDFNEEIKGSRNFRFANTVIEILQVYKLKSLIIFWNFQVAPSPVKKAKTDSSIVQNGTKIKHEEEKQGKKRRSNEENEVKNAGKERCSEEMKKPKSEGIKSPDERKKIKEETKTKVKPETLFEARIKSSAVPPKDVPKPVVQPPKGAAKEVTTIISLVFLHFNNFIFI